ncbi:MAG: hypothetical protein IKN60_00120, partial [Bacteroidales bacterium]|nr:hypothetical protein [Bacteroidales bacterium]
PQPAAKAAARPPAARPAPVAASDEEAYQLAFKAIGRQDPKICIFLKKGRFAGVEDDEALVEFPQDGSELLAKLLAAPEKRAVVDQCLTEAFGRPMRLRTTQPGAPKKAAAPGGRKNLDRIYEAFPRDKIEIIDE